MPRNPVVISLYDSINGIAADVVQQIRAAGARPIEVRINSQGGSVFEGYSIYNALLAHAPGVDMHIDGLAASIASYIAMAGRTISMAENAMMMIHNPSSFVDGGADDMRRAAQLLDKVTESITNAYARRTKQPAHKITAMLDAETWLTADMAKELGFCDFITAPQEMAAHFDISNFRNAPEELIKIMKTEQNPNLSANEALELANKEVEKVNAEFARVTAESEVKLAAVTAELETARNETIAIKAQFDVAATEATAAKSEVGRLTNELSGAQKTITEINAKLAESGTNIDRLETLCQLKGIDPKAAIAPNNDPQDQSPEDLVATMQAIKDPNERTNFYRNNRAAIDAANQKLHSKS